MQFMELEDVPTTPPSQLGFPPEEAQQNSITDYDGDDSDDSDDDDNDDDDVSVPQLLRIPSGAPASHQRTNAIHNQHATHDNDGDVNMSPNTSSSAAASSSSSSSSRAAARDARSSSTSPDTSVGSAEDGTLQGRLKRSAGGAPGGVKRPERKRARPQSGAGEGGGGASAARAARAAALAGVDEDDEEDDDDDGDDLPEEEGDDSDLPPLYPPERNNPGSGDEDDGEEEDEDSDDERSSRLRQGTKRRSPPTSGEVEARRGRSVRARGNAGDDDMPSRRGVKPSKLEASEDDEDDEYASDDEDDEYASDDEDDGGASSSAPRGSKRRTPPVSGGVEGRAKRVRPATSQPGPKPGKLEADEDDEDDYEMASSDDDDAQAKAPHPNDELPDEDDDDGTVQPQVDNSVAEMGILQRVALKNFMSHGNFSIELRPHVNFISGKNGSGKSAILVGIQTCFGARASETNRGSSLKELIRRGTQRATVEVSIKNEGEEAYPGYGRTIIVQRVIQRYGNGGYKLMDARRKVVSTRREDLDKILEHMGIQVSNPCMVMTQDRSRELLQAKDNRKMYKLFKDATLLTAIEERMDQTTTKLRATKEQLRAALPNVRAAKEERDAAFKVKKEAESAESLVAKIQCVTQRALWAGVHAAESSLQEAVQNVALLEKKQAAQTAKVEKLEEAEAVLDAQMNERKQAAEEAQQARRQAMHALNELEAQQSAHTRQLSKLKRQVKVLAKDYKKVVAKKEAILKRKERARRDALREAQSAQGAAAKTQVKLDKVMDALERTKARADAEGASELEVKRAEAERLQGERDNVVSRYSAANERKQELRQQIRRLERQERSPWNAFEKGIELKEAIEANVQRFHVKPEGPIGRCIELKQNVDVNYSHAIQEAIGARQLKTYIVHDRHDAELLKRLFRQVGVHGYNRPNIMRFKKSDRRYDVRRPHGSVLDAGTGAVPVSELLEYSSPWVYNALINTAKLDKRVVTESIESAYDVANAGRGGITVVTKDRTTVTLRNGNTQSKPPGRDRLHLLSANLAPEIERLREELARVDETLAALGKARREATSCAKEARREVDKVERGHRELIKQIERLTDKQRDLEEQLEQDRLNEDAPEFDSSEFDEEIETMDELLATIETKQQAAERELAEYHVPALDADAMATVQKRAHAADEAERRCAAAVEQTMNTTIKLRGKKAKLVSKAQSLNEMLDKWREQEQQRRVMTETMAREAMGQHGDSEREAAREKTVGEWSARLEKLEEQLSVVEERLGGSRADLEERFKDALEKFNYYEQQIEQLKVTRAKLKAAIQARKEEQWRFRKAIASKARRTFHRYMRCGRHEASLHFDHEHSDIDFTVRVNGSNQGASSAAPGTKGLSGGERSYTTLAFVMALGESAEAPFRVLDEFDVFMDSVNRKISIELLMRIAKAKRSRQFIFITPLDISMIESDQFTQVFKLKAPQRGGQSQDAQ